MGKVSEGFLNQYIKMKKSVFVALTLGVALMITATGCHRKPVDLTNIPGARPDAIKLSNGGDLTPGQPVFNPTGPGTGVSTDDTKNAYPQDALADRIKNTPGHGENRDLFSKNTVYFDLDKSTTKASEQPKLESVANYFKSKQDEALLVEGHCDERGTEGYNISLGDRRAMAVREYLINLGMPAGQITTVSYGESRPAETGHNEAAWSKNRRGVSVLLTMPK